MTRSTKEWLRFALEDAISWQESLLDAHCSAPNDPEVPIIKEQLAAYRKILKRRYPPRNDPTEGAKRVSVFDIRKSRREEAISNPVPRSGKSET